MGSVAELRDAGPVNTGLGRPAVSLKLVERSSYVLGAHIGAGMVGVSLADLNAAVLTMSSEPVSPGANGAADVTAMVAAAAERLLAETGIDRRRVLGLGLGVPGPVDLQRRRNLLSINYGWTDVPFADALEARLGIPVVVEHNVSAMALAEAFYGIGRDAEALLYVYLRTGLGAGLIVEGRPFRPGGHGALELGHIQVVEEGAVCACGSTGCLETFVSEAALARAAGLAERHPRNLLAAVEAHRKVWDGALGHLTTGIAIAVNLLNPDLIVFGGHLAEAPESFLDHLRASVPPRVFPPLRNRLRIERSSLGSGGGVIGAAAVALDHFFYSGLFL